MSDRRPFLHWLLLFALIAMWGSSFLFNELAIESLHPTLTVAARLYLAAAVLLVVLLVTRRRLPRCWRSWCLFSVMGIVGNALPFWLITWGQKGIDSGQAGILMAIMPLTTVLLAHYFVGESLTWQRIAGFVLGFFGIVVLTGPEALRVFEGQGAALVSQVSVLGGAVCYALNVIIARRFPLPDPMITASGVTVMAAILITPTAMIVWPSESIALQTRSILAVIILGLTSTALASILYFKLISLAGAGFVSMINYLIPLWALAIGIVFLGEQPGWNALGALLLILSGIALAEVGAGHMARRHGTMARP